MVHTEVVIMLSATKGKPMAMVMIITTSRYYFTRFYKDFYVSSALSFFVKKGLKHFRNVHTVCFFNVKQAYQKSE